tara:strand:+ start:181 stop:876 length:696 start_codon:yes stop_codon:yes gene_type:complete
MVKSGFRKISKDKYLVAGIITFLIFSLGLTLGFLLEDHRYNLVEEVNTEQDINYLSLQLQYLYLNAFSNQDNCPILATTLKTTVKDLSDSLGEVIAFEEEKDISETRRNAVMRRYVLDNLRYWLLARESQQRCNLDIVPILYFYAKACPSCPNQGTVLTYFKNLFGEQVLVFPINLDLVHEEPMVEIVASQFDITRYPTIIINNKKYEGVVKKDQLQKLICESLQDSEHCS